MDAPPREVWISKITAEKALRVNGWVPACEKPGPDDVRYVRADLAPSARRVPSVRESMAKAGIPFVDSGEVERLSRPGGFEDSAPTDLAPSAQPSDRERRLAEALTNACESIAIHGEQPPASPEAPASEKAKRVYLCARYSRHPEMQGVAAQLRALGYEVTSRWIEGNHDVSDLNGGSGEHFAQEDWDDLRAASILIAFTEGPKPNGRNRGGRHVEFGAALALGQRVIVIGPRENVFHHLPEVEVFDDVSSCLASLAVRR